MWAPLYSDSRICSVMAFFLLFRLSTSVVLMLCHVSGGDTVFIMCTRMASKMAAHMVWRGSESFSSCSEMAGYLALLMVLSIV